MGKITCPKHQIEFEALDGCPQCIADRQAEEAKINSPENIGKRIKEAEERVTGPNIVKVRYYSETTGEASGREYSYFAIDPLKVGDVIQVPVRDHVQKAIVTAVDVPESEIESFKDQIKTIPSGHIIRTGKAPTPPDQAEEVPAPTLFDQAPSVQEEGIPIEAAAETVTAEFDQEGPAEKPAALVVIETQVGKPTNDLFVLYQEAASLLRVAKDRVISTNEDLKPATNDLAIIATCKKAMFARKTEIVEPFKARLDAINQAFADLMFPVLEADRLTRGQVSTFDTEQRRKAAEAQRIEDEKLRLAREEEKLTGEHTVELGTAPSPPPVPERTRTDLGTLGGRANWKARVVDFALLPDDYKLPNESKLNSHARSTKGERPIPGVEFYDDHVVTMRTR